MQNILSTRQSLFINDSLNSAVRTSKNSALGVENNTALEQNSVKEVLEGQVIKRGEPDNFAQADDIFERAEYFRTLSNSAKQGLQAYSSIDNELKREQIKAMMGVDLYA